MKTKSITKKKKSRDVIFSHALHTWTGLGESAVTLVRYIYNIM